MSDQICNQAHKCTLRCLGRSAHYDGLNCDTGHCELDVHCVPVEQPADVADLVTACESLLQAEREGDGQWLAQSLKTLRTALAPFAEVSE